MFASDYFDAMYAHNSDPWGFRSRWYEQRKRTLLLATLPALRYRHAFEPGCANGELTAELAARCDNVTAGDISARAVALTRRRVKAASHVAVTKLAIPHKWPTAIFDLIVFNEIGYYLNSTELLQTLTLITNTLAASGIVVVCHWRHAVEGSELDGKQVHDAFNQCAGLTRQSHYCERDFLLEIFSKIITHNDSNEVSTL